MRMTSAGHGIRGDAEGASVPQNPTACAAAAVAVRRRCDCHVGAGLAGGDGVTNAIIRCACGHRFILRTGAAAMRLAQIFCREKVKTVALTAVLGVVRRAR